MSELRPNLSDITLRFDILQDFRVQLLSDASFRALLELVALTAAGRVWTYSEPSDGALPCNDRTLARLLRISLHKWRRAKPELEPFFEQRDGKWFLLPDWVLIGEQGTVRPTIPAALRSEVLRRDQFTCIYCGIKEGPFDCDHIVPLAAGGATTADNLITACAPCNRSKGARTPAQWLGSETRQ